MNTTTDIATLSVNEVIRRFPATLALFHQYGIDSCCGGAISVAAAAARQDAHADVFLAELQQLIDESRAVLAPAPAAVALDSGACCCLPRSV